MIKRIFMMLVVITIILGISKGYSEENSTATLGQNAAAQEAKEPQDAGNKICPVSGEKIEEGTKATYEYKSKIYNFCCASCIPEFKKNPEKYIQKMKEEAQAESGKEEKMPGMKMMEDSGAAK